jgi:hypothetical protein
MKPLAPCATAQDNGSGVLLSEEAAEATLEIGNNNKHNIRLILVFPIFFHPDP